MRSATIILLLGLVFLQSALLSESVAVMSIDLGSEWMKIAIVKPGVPMEIVLNKESKRKTEAIVSLRNGERVFGSSAKSKGVRFPSSAYQYLQDLLGKTIDSPLVVQYQKRFPHHKIEEDKQTGNIYFVHDEDKGIHYTPEELMAMILSHAKSLAEEYSETIVDEVVITVPSYYSQAERKALLYAAKLAGLKVSQLMDVNTAAALNYGVFRSKEVESTAQYLMLYDIGASGTEASVVAYQLGKVNGEVDPQLSVKGHGFDRTLGGLEMDLRLRDLLVKKFNEKKRTKSDVTKNPRAMAKLLKEANRVKKVLSANVDHTAQIEGLIDDEDFKARVTREEFEGLCSDLWERLSKPMNDALELAGVTMDQITSLIVIGGATRVPKVQELLLKASGKSELGRNLNADEAAALGSSYQAAALSSGFKVKTFHVRGGATYPIEINFQRDTEQDDGSITQKNIKRTLFQRSNPYPQRKVITFNRFQKDFPFSVNYGDASFLGEEGEKILGSRNIADVELSGVKEAHDKYSKQNDTESKGVKAHFRMDESGILNLESVEAVYEGNRTETVEVEDSTFQKKDGDETEEKENKSSEDSKEKSEGEKKTEEKAENKTKDEKEGDEKVIPKSQETKVVKFKQSAPIVSVITSLDHKTPSAESLETSNKKLKDLADIDAAKLAREIALNKLETFIYEKKDRLYSEVYEEALTDEEREKITEALNEASEWMDFLEGEPEAEVYDKKRDELRLVCRPWLLRVKQRRDNGPLLKDMESLFNHTSVFLKAVKALSEDDQLYTEVEIKTLADKYEEVVTWKNATVKEEAGLKPFQDPVLLPADIKAKITSLNREVSYLLNKAKTAKPKSKKSDKEEKKKDKKKKSSTKGEQTEDKTEEKAEKKAEAEDEAEEKVETTIEEPETVTDSTEESTDSPKEEKQEL